ncbi:MAG: hypothetical protein ACX98W_13570 [bacterium]
MTDSVLLVDREAPLAVVTLNRPDRMNALSSELRLALGAASGSSRPIPRSAP